jgi:uncharacterized integral membrane protein
MLFILNHIIIIIIIIIIEKNVSRIPVSLFFGE